MKVVSSVACLAILFCSTSRAAEVGDFFDLFQLLGLEMELVSANTTEDVATTELQPRRYAELVELMADPAGTDKQFLNGLVYSSAHARRQMMLAGTPFMSDAKLVSNEKSRGYIQTIIQLEKLSLQLGLRQDESSVYGSVLTSRASVTYQLNEKSAYRLSYGEGHLVPSALQAFDGGSGGIIARDLESEASKSIEANWLFRSLGQYHNVSIFSAEHVHLRALNTSVELRTRGVEYKGRFELYRFDWSMLTATTEAYVNASYTDTKVSHIYPGSIGWVGHNSELEGIAPIKLNGGINLLLSDSWNVNFRGRIRSAMEHHFGNPWRNYDLGLTTTDGDKIPSFGLLDVTASYLWPAASLSLKVTNLFDKKYLRPNVFLSYLDYDLPNRSKAEINSFIPQEGRAFELLFKMKW